MHNRDNMANRKNVGYLEKERAMKGALIVAKGQHRG
jgi:hypothetical protein